LRRKACQTIRTSKGGRGPSKGLVASVLTGGWVCFLVRFARHSRNRATANSTNLGHFSRRRAPRVLSLSVRVSLLTPVLVSRLGAISMDMSMSLERMIRSRRTRNVSRSSRWMAHSEILGSLVIGSEPESLFFWKISGAGMTGSSSGLSAGLYGGRMVVGVLRNALVAFFPWPWRASFVFRQLSVMVWSVELLAVC